jgi:hypothetical protein
MKGEGDFRQSGDWLVARDFIRKHLSGNPRLQTYEKVYQISQRIALSRLSKSFLGVIRSLVREHVEEMRERLGETQDIGEGLCAFEARLEATREIFTKIFNPIITARGGLHTSFSRFFHKLARRILGAYENRLMDHLEHLIRLEQGEGLAPASCIQSILHLLKKYGRFKRSIPCIVKALLKRYECDLSMDMEDLAGMKAFLDRERKVEYLRGDFYLIETGMVKAVVQGLRREKVVEVLKEKREAELCHSLFVLAGEESRFNEILTEYLLEAPGASDTSNFVALYYLMDTEIQELFRRGLCRHPNVAKVVDVCKSKLVNSNVQRCIRGTCGWLDRCLREGGAHEVGEVLGVPVDAVLQQVGFNNAHIRETLKGEYILADIFRVVGEVFNLCDSKEEFELGLRVSLGNRLLSGSYASLEAEESFVKIFGKAAGRGSSHKMRSMLAEFDERRAFMSGEVLLLGKCKWPEYEDVELKAPDLDSFKREFEKGSAKQQRRKIRWVNSLSTCVIELLGASITVSLIQYVLLQGLCEGARRMEDFGEGSLWKEHMGVLADGGLVILRNGACRLNMAWRGENGASFVPKSFRLLSENGKTKTFDRAEPSKSIIDCKIVGIMKQNKEMTRAELYSAIGAKHSRALFNESLGSLVVREFLAVEGEVVRYLP